MRSINISWARWEHRKKLGDGLVLIGGLKTVDNNSCEYTELFFWESCVGNLVQLWGLGTK
jgi:hypothetical protein